MNVDKFITNTKTPKRVLNVNTFLLYYCCYTAATIITLFSLKMNYMQTHLLTLTATACRKSIWRHHRSTKQNALWLATTCLCSNFHVYFRNMLPGIRSLRGPPLLCHPLFSPPLPSPCLPSRPFPSFPLSSPALSFCRFPFFSLSSPPLPIPPPRSGPKSSYGVWGYAMSSLNEIRGEAPAANAF